MPAAAPASVGVALGVDGVVPGAGVPGAMVPGTPVVPGTTDGLAQPGPAGEEITGPPTAGAGE
jgi:hypothetical protein